MHLESTKESLNFEYHDAVRLTNSTTYNNPPSEEVKKYKKYKGKFENKKSKPKEVLNPSFK